MPIGELARHLSDLELAGYRVNSYLPGHSLGSMSMTPGVTVVDAARSTPGRSCQCDPYNCTCCMGCDGNPCAGLCHSRED